MKHTLYLATMAASLVVAGSVPAQLAKGSDAPTFPFDAALNGAPTSFDDLENRVVLVDFFATW